MTNKDQDYHKEIADKLIERLKEGTAPWQRPFEYNVGAFPHNHVTGKKYSGLNTVRLMLENHDDPRWMTEKQANSVGAKVQKGQTPATIMRYQYSEKKIKLDDKGKPVLDENGEKIKEDVPLHRPRAYFHKVYNASQIDGLPPLELKARDQKWDGIERVEKILQESKANIVHHGNNAYYSVANDSIHLPNKSQFPSAENYYSTAIHELGHWTGHPSRLNRDMKGSFGSKDYAREELRAEIANLMVCDDLKMGHDPSRHVAYVGSWVKILTDKPREIVDAVRDADKIKKHILSFDRSQEKEKSSTKDSPAQEKKPETQARSEVPSKPKKQGFSR